MTSKTDTYSLSFLSERGLYAAVLASPEHTVTSQFYPTKADALDAACEAIAPRRERLDPDGWTYEPPRPDACEACDAFSADDAHLTRFRQFEAKLTHTCR